MITGDFGALPGGPAGIAVGAQIREEESHSDYSDLANRDAFMFVVGNPVFSSSRQVTAAFVELLLPVSDQLDLQLAARIEDYGDGVDSTDPKLSALWRPNDSFAVRASVGTSFRAPSIFQVFGTQTTLEELTDPLFPAGTQFLRVRTQPNLSGKTLRPETADVANLGFSWSPNDNLELGLDYWSFDYTDVIIQQNPQALLGAGGCSTQEPRCRSDLRAFGRLPKDGCRISGNMRIRRDNRHSIQNRLRHETSIERIPVMGRQQRVVCSTLLIECKRFQHQPLPSAWHVIVRRQTVTVSPFSTVSI